MKKNNCTWENCINEAITPQIGKNGIQWANLCDIHTQELDGAIKPNNPKGILRAWILAQGGSKKAAKSMMDTI